ncbi:MAG: hypothetical protein A2V76_10385 [Candidatus Aminicenantes bacterium RBG_16_63_14]|nr:MAG: hypothetical protein A2V76_10385 [Candidatus Aminicenantes bacterium RBG_16_63_14]
MIEAERALAFEGPPCRPAKSTVGMGMTRRAAEAMVVILSLTVAAASGGAKEQAVERWKAVEVAAAANEADEALLGRPLSLALDAECLYVADAQDCAVKVFSKDGRFLRAFGRKGRGPGELTFPSGVSVVGGRVYVADKLNYRIQIFDGEGKPRGGYPVPFAPDKVFAMGAETLLITGNPTGRRAGEMLLHIYGDAGRLRWEGLEARSSSDPMYDTFRNMILVCPGEEKDFYVVFRSGDRTILRFAGTGVLRGKTPVDERHAFRPLDMPFKGPKKRLLGFCWAAARDRGLFYLSAPEPVDGKDLGPGRRLSVIDKDGRLQAVVELPCPVHRFVVEEDRVFAIDDEGGLRIFEIVR